MRSIVIAMTSAPGEFAAVERVLRGERLPLDHAGSKMLMFILRDPSGCDATIDRHRFEIRYDWHPTTHPYALSVAPVVVSELLALAAVQGATTRVRARVRPRVIARIGMFPAWQFGRRLLWLDATDRTVTFSVRDAALGLSLDDAVAPIPEPIGLAPFVDFDPSLPCPHCHEHATRYRQLSDGSLVCQACGRSFRAP
jgi:hypothetical protein